MSADPVMRVISYDHGGYIAWGWWKGWEGPGGVKDCMRRALGRLDRWPALKWGFHVDGATWDWARANDPRFVDGFLRLIDTKYAGRVSLSSGGYGQPLSWTVGDEANIRHLVHDHEAYARLGRRVSIYMQNEHGFFPQLPQLLRGVGIQKAIMRTVWGMYGICPEIDGSKVLWRSPDGSTVEVIPTYRGGNRGLGKNAWDTRIFIGLEGPIDLEPFRTYCLRRSIAHPVAVRIDDFHLPRETDGSGGFTKLCSYSEAPGYRWVTGEEAFAEIPLEETVLDTRIDDYPIQMPWGYEGNLFWNLSRRAECALLAAERLAALNVACGGAGWETTIGNAWKSLLTAQHHDINICGVSSGGEYGEFLFDVARRLYGEATEAAETVTRGVLMSMCHRAAAQTADRLVVAHNALGWERQAIVEVRIKLEQGRIPKAFSLSRDGRPLEIQLKDVATEPGGALSFATIAFPALIGPLGLATAALRFGDSTAPAAPPPNPPATMTQELPGAVEVAAAWGRVSVDRRTGECLVSDLGGAPLLVPAAGSGQLLGTVDGVSATSMASRLEVVAGGPLYSVIRVSGSVGPLPCRTDIVVYRDAPRIDFRVTVEVNGQTVGAEQVPAEWNGKDEPMDQEQKLSLRFVPALDGSPRVLQDAPFSIDETKNKFINAGLWTCVTDGKRSVTLANRGTMGYLWDGRVLRNILLYSGKYSWGERHAYLVGSYTNECGLFFHKGRSPALSAHRAGQEFNFPPASHSCTPRDGGLALENLGLDIRDADTRRPCSHLHVSALYPRAGELYLRVCDSSGAGPTRIVAAFCGQPVRLQPVDLLHAGAGEGEEVAEVPSFAIRTYRLVPLAGAAQRWVLPADDDWNASGGSYDAAGRRAP